MKKSLLIFTMLLVISAAGTLAVKKYLLKGKTVSESVGKPVSIEQFISDEVARMEIFINGFEISDSTNKHNRLNQLGFISAEGRNNSAQELRDVGRMMKEFKKMWPDNVFINYKIAADILDNYELSFGTVDRYTGKVPEQAITDMEKFIPYARFSRSHFMVDGIHRTPKEISQILHGFGSIRNSAANIDEEMVLDLKYSGPKKFYIIAPKSKFSGEANSNGTFVTDKYSDPIVLYPVIGGYIIVTAW